MIDLMENKVLAPLILRQYVKGLEEGRREDIQQGRQEGRQGMLADLLAEKFGPLPTWITERLQSATDEDLQRWAKRMPHSDSLEDTLR